MWSKVVDDIENSLPTDIFVTIAVLTTTITECLTLQPERDHFAVPGLVAALHVTHVVALVLQTRVLDDQDAVEVAHLGILRHGFSLPRPSVPPHLYVVVGAVWLTRICYWSLMSLIYTAVLWLKYSRSDVKQHICQSVDRYWSIQVATKGIANYMI